MKEREAATDTVWQKAPYTNLVRYIPSGKYFARLRVNGKLIRRCLKTNKISVAKLRLPDLEKVERQRVETQGAIANGNQVWRRRGDIEAVVRR